ncbi:MAG: TrbC/VirB2 family protein [Streptococcus salivarius]|nr:TrbC/VirB2 family protein [Streptococcus salivarius]
MKNNFFKKATTLASLLVLSAHNKLVFADDDPFAKTGRDITKIGKDIKLFAYVVAVVCFIIAGLLIMLGDEGKKKGMGWLPAIIIGLLVISLAAAAVGYMQGLGG